MDWDMIFQENQDTKMHWGHLFVIPQLNSIPKVIDQMEYYLND